MGIVYDFQYYKHRFDEKIICVNDIVQWQDYDQKMYTGKIKKIEYHKKDLSFLKQEHKNDAIFYFANTLIIDGSLIIKKIVNKDNFKKAQTNLKKAK